jgi:Tfp pilus assembly protein PilO
MQISTSTKQLREYLETKRGKTYLISIVTLVTVAVMLVFAIVPAILSITDKFAQNNTRREYLSALERNESVIKKLLKEEQDFNSTIVKLNSALPSEVNDEYVLANVSEMTASTGSQLIFMDFKVPVVTDLSPTNNNLKMVMEVPITLSVQGSLSSLSEFLEKVETFPMPISVDTFSLSNKSVSSLSLDRSKGDYVMSMEISYYYYNDVAK